METSGFPNEKLGAEQLGMRGLDFPSPMQPAAAVLRCGLSRAPA